MTMTVAGHYPDSLRRGRGSGRPLRKKRRKIAPVIKATVEKMASITEKFLKGYEIPAVYVVGGSASFTGIYQRV